MSEIQNEMLSSEEFFKRYPSSEYNRYTYNELKNYMQDIVKAEDSEEIEKAKKNLGKLVKKIVVNKSGKKQGVWVQPNKEQPKVKEGKKEEEPEEGKEPETAGEKERKENNKLEGKKKLEHFFNSKNMSFITVPMDTPDPDRTGEQESIVYYKDQTGVYHLSGENKGKEYVYKPNHKK